MNFIICFLVAFEENSSLKFVKIVYKNFTWNKSVVATAASARVCKFYFFCFYFWDFLQIQTSSWYIFFGMGGFAQQMLSVFLSLMFFDANCVNVSFFWGRKFSKILANSRQIRLELAVDRETAFWVSARVVVWRLAIEQGFSNTWYCKLWRLI